MQALAQSLAGTDGPAQNVLDLGACRHLFRGGMRDVYQHPAAEHLLLKVIRPDRVDASGQFAGKRAKRLARGRPFGVYTAYVREVREMLRADRKLFAAGDPSFPFERVRGFVRTTQGLAIVVEKVAAADGSPAPTLADLVARGQFTPAHREKVEHFFRLCTERHFVFGEMHAKNLVYDERDGGRFVCIDSIGEKCLIPIHEWSPFLNRLRVRKWRRRLFASLAKHSAKAEPRPLAAMPA